MILSDTSILSSFAAARDLPLLLAALEGDTIFIPPAVEQELRTGLARGVTHLQNVLGLIPTGQVQLLNLDESDLECVASLPEALGLGEREAIALCLRHGATLLCNDRRVVRYCDEQGIMCLDLASLLRKLWTEGIATRAKVKTMIVRMEKAENLVFDEVREFAAKLHAEGKPWKGEAFGWQAEYNPERPEPPLDSQMTFTPADFCIGESGIWFFSLMWEHGSNKDPVEFLDDRNILS